MRKFPAIQWNRQNVILFHQTIPLNQSKIKVRFLNMSVETFIFIFNSASVFYGMQGRHIFYALLLPSPQKSAKIYFLIHLFIFKKLFTIAAHRRLRDRKKYPVNSHLTNLVRNVPGPVYTLYSYEKRTKK
jgi:hypothetical protein